MNNRRYDKTLCFLFAATLGLPVSMSAAGEGPTAGRLSVTMSWNEIHQAMESYPPSFDYGDERLQIMKYVAPYY